MPRDLTETGRKIIKDLPYYLHGATAGNYEELQDSRLLGQKSNRVCPECMSKCVAVSPTSSFPFFTSLLLVLFLPSYSLPCHLSRYPLPFTFCLLFQPSFFLVPSIPHYLYLSLRFLPFTRYLASPLIPYYPLPAPTFLPQFTPPLSHPQSLSSFPISPPSFFTSLSLSPEPSY
jgi:hypothetical protein